MQTGEILKSLREKNNLTQDQMADRVMVSRQAVSQWENGKTQPNTEGMTETERRNQYNGWLSQLKHWK